MIPVVDKVADVINTLDGEVMDLGFSSDPKDLIHIMSLLTNIYSDNETACIREYSTNAWDAQIENGISEPIVVTTPTTLNPYLRIKDKGCGLSANDLRNMWRIYGKSSKRDREDQNGSMGIGAKSALAYTNQFSIVSVKNGRKVHVSISRKADGGASAEIVSEIVSDEPSGTEIVIPAARYNNFEVKARKLFRYWEKGSVLLNGGEPSQRDKLTKITDRIFHNPFDNQNDIIFMGNVPYPVKNNIGVLRLTGHGIIAFVGMGSEDQVKYSPSRESLIYNDQTNEVIERLTKEYDERVIASIRADIDRCASHSEALKKYRSNAQSYLNWDNKKHDVTFNGEEFPPARDRITHAIPPFAEYTGDYVIWAPSRNRNVTYRYQPNWENVRWVVYNYPHDVLPSADHRRKTRMYVTDTLNKGFGGGNVVYTTKAQPKQFHNYKWYTDRFIDWEEIRKIRIKSDRSSYIKSDEWQVVISQYGTTNTRDDIKPDQKIIYWSSSKENDIPSSIFDLLTRHYPDAMMIREPITRHKRLVREFPNSMTLSEAKAAIRQKLEKAGVTEKDQMIFNVRSIHSLAIIANLVGHTEVSGGEKIKDTTLLEMVSMYGGKAEYSQSTKDLMLFVGQAAFKNVPQETATYVSKNYPLVQQVNTYNMNALVRAELVFYINKKHEEREGK